LLGDEVGMLWAFPWLALQFLGVFAQMLFVVLAVDGVCVDWVLTFAVVAVVLRSCYDEMKCWSPCWCLFAECWSCW